MEKIVIGNLNWLRNDYRKDIMIGGIIFPTLEHAYQASKTKDRSIKKQIATTESVSEARKIGRSINKSDDFDTESSMTLLLRQKFSDKELGEMLASLGSVPIVMEGYDDFWGTGNDGNGQNMMGEILQTLRSDLQFLYGIDPEEDEEDDEEDEEDDEEDIPTLKDALLNGVDETLATACQNLLEGAKAVMSVVDANDYNAEYISRKTGVSRDSIEIVIEKVRKFHENIIKLENLLETPSDDISSDESGEDPAGDLSRMD
jgi:N-glycosidase YbiA